MRAEQAIIMATYNRWMNERLYAVCAELPDEERKQDRGAFFRSIHGTLNHLLLADKIWLGRFEGVPFPAISLDQELFTDFSALRSERESTDSRIEAWVSGLSDEMLTARLHYTSIVDAAPRTYTLWVTVVHFFNHQTHHRGQLTTLLSQCGKGYGVTDLIWLPEFVQNNNAT